MTKHLVFVYGTLKRAGWNNPILSDAEFIGAATTRLHYPMAGHDGGVPFVYNLPQHDKAAPVRGEVWRVDDATLARLDRLEGHPRHYERKPVSACFNGTVAHVEAWLYFGPPAHTASGRPMRDPVDGEHEWRMPLPPLL